MSAKLSLPVAGPGRRQKSSAMVNISYVLAVPCTSRASASVMARRASEYSGSANRSVATVYVGLIPDGVYGGVTSGTRR